MFKFITTRPLWVNLLVAAGFFLLLLVLFFSSLGFLTKHNEYAKVPQVTGRNIDEATRLLELQGFEVQVQDSVYLDNAARLSVIRQSPEADAVVKTNRTIYLTINRAIPPLVDMPDLRGFSYMSAKLYLQSLGLKMGDTSYTPDIAKNAVKEQLLNGKTVNPGTKIDMGSTIDFVLGSGIGTTEVNVPDVIGMTLAQARDYLSNVGLNISTVNPEGTVTDKENAFVTRQSPEALELLPDGTTTNKKIRAGQLIDIWISATPPVRDTTATPVP